MAQVLILHGPNLNLLGTREPSRYGATSLDELNQKLAAKAKTLGHQIECYQSNAESELITKIHKAQEHVDFMIINPAAYTHTSIAIRDAILAVNIPFIEVHISNIFKREKFRQHSYFSDIAIGVISGLGVNGYLLAMDAAHEHLTNQRGG